MQVITNDSVRAAFGYNEAEIRFHIIDPIIRFLGYPGTADVYINLEEKLEYPYIHIGRRSKKDLPLGFPDYRAGLKGARGSFIVEAKAGAVPITLREVEQAHSYAAHAQVGANFFVLCNGERIAIYETLSGPQAEAVVNIPLNEVNERFHEVENILSPINLAKNCHVEYDTKLKLVEGLGSSVQIRSGHYLMADCDFRIMIDGEDWTSFLRQAIPEIANADKELELLKTAFELRVSGGSALRGDDGRITAHVEFSGATIHNHKAMEIMGITDAHFVTADKFISTDPENPSIFDSISDFKVSRGTVLPNLLGGETVLADGDVEGDMYIKVAMYYSKGLIKGQYIALSDQNFNGPNIRPFTAELDLSGTFELVLDV